MSNEYLNKLLTATQNTTSANAANATSANANAANATSANANASSISRSSESATAESDSTKTLEQLEDEVFDLESQKGLNYKKMQKIEAEIQELTESIKKKLKDAKELQKESIEQHEEEAKKAVEDNINAYVEANKEGGKGMTREELEANISKSMPNTPNLAKALGKYVAASQEMGEVDSLLGSLNSLIIDTNVIEMDLSSKTKSLDALKTQQSQKKCCDPIGFTKDGARYDFIVDDGSFDSTSDFLGADNQWASMEALDKDGDKVIDASELKEANIKMVKTVNGEKKVVDVADEFGEDFKVDLTTYQQGGSFDGIDTTKDSDNDGTVDQQLLGTYTIHVGNEDIKGYNTLDDTDYLASEYGINKASTKAQTATAAADTSKYSDELKQHSNFFDEYSKTMSELDNELYKELAALGLTEDTIKTIKDRAKSEGKKEADKEMKKIEEKAKEEQKVEDEERKKKLEEERKKRKEEEEAAAQAAAQAQAAANANTNAGTNAATNAGTNAGNTGDSSGTTPTATPTQDSTGSWVKVTNSDTLAAYEQYGINSIAGNYRVAEGGELQQYVPGAANTGAQQPEAQQPETPTEQT